MKYHLVLSLTIPDHNCRPFNSTAGHRTSTCKWPCSECSDHHSHQHHNSKHFL